jgi:hypothetical protein
MLQRTLSSWGRLLGLRRKPALEEEEEDRRLRLRFPCSIETTCRPAGTGPGGAGLRALVQDVSQGGVNLLVSQAFSPGELLCLDLPRSKEGPGGWSTLLTCVVWAEPRDGAWALGCNFSAELSDEDLRAFGARRARAPEPDQRGWQRFPCQAHVSCQSIRAPEGPPCQAKALNVSASGLALEIDAPLEAGDLLSLEMRDAGGRAVLTTLASVVRVTVPESGPRTLGCNFIHELSADHLQALL